MQKKKRVRKARGSICMSQDVQGRMTEEESNEGHQGEDQRESTINKI